MTGCTNGLGLHCVKHLSRELKSNEDAFIIFGCRNLSAARDVADSISKTENFPRSRLIVLDTPLDTSEMSSVRSYTRAVIDWLGTEKRIKALINNAGIGGNPVFTKTSAGHEKIFATNHLGHFLLTVLLLPFIDERIVNVSSEVHDPATKTPLPDPELGWPSSDHEYDHYLLKGEPLSGENDQTSGGRRYSRSKLCNIFFTNELALRLTGTIPAYIDSTPTLVEQLAQRPKCTLPHARNIKVTSFNPGLMLDTNFATGVAGRFLGGFVYILSPLLRLSSLGKIMRDGGTSGKNLADIATGRIDASATATYFSDRESHSTSVFSLSERAVTKLQVELWDLSIQWAGITKEELEKAGL